MEAAVTRPLELENGSVLFFDGVCNLCNQSVDFLIRRDRRGTLRYAPLQGETAAKTLPAGMTSGTQPSVVLLDAKGVHLRSTAALRALKALGGGWAGLASALLLVPRPIRDFVYDRIAKSRYRVWGKRDTCRLPTPEERSRFLE